MNLRSSQKALKMKVKLCPVSGAYGLGRDSNAWQGKHSQRDCTSGWTAMELSSASRDVVLHTSRVPRRSAYEMEGSGAHQQGTTDARTG